MTHDDWMALTNRPDVVEKDMVKLLDWFIKVVSSEVDFSILCVLTDHPYQNYPSGGISQLLYKDFFPASATGERLAELVFRILDEDNGGSIGFPEIQKVFSRGITILKLRDYFRRLICATQRLSPNKFSGLSESSMWTTQSQLQSMSSEIPSDKFGQYLTASGRRSTTRALART